MVVHPLFLAQFAFDLEPASRALSLCSSSLVSSCRTPLPLWQVGGADLKQSGLRFSVLFSATQNLAYLPCRIARDGSIFRFFVGGVFRKKVFPPARPPGLCFHHDTMGKFAATSPTFSQGGLLCGLRTITKRQRCFGRTLVFFTQPHNHRLRTRSVVVRLEVDRRSGLMLHREPNQECCAQNSSCPVAARRAAFFRPSRAVMATAPTTAASPSSPVVSSPSSRRFCFWIKPDSACRNPSPRTSASGIGIGWRRSACDLCWGKQPDELCVPP